ncbi:gluconokinase [Vibrio nigripulchritudo]|uniref:gluconokinase n=1 Tax=Vibrio nigripulchritudo TaxID=28173 RepID=UPI00190E200E|nr:gluconokinase [Vibrio nigripulchritudo]BCL72584.1 gluconokinase [Vibrio nigripulchritudo]BDU33943.1 gluconokinase [Vibrio nigripulchritudo]
MAKEMHGVNTKKILVMGVSGCGKSLIGKRLADTLDLTFFDGDDYHSATNIEKMKQGIPLSDEDRFDWLHTLNELFVSNENVVIACSALKPEYRDILRINNEDVTVIYLQGDFDTIWSRHKSRSNHYFNGKQMLESQFATLIEPTSTEAIAIDISMNAEEVLQLALTSIQRIDK